MLFRSWYFTFFPVRHSHTCCKNTKRECRFNYPQPPMRQTEILYPLDTDVAKTETKNTRTHGNQLNCI